MKNLAVILIITHKEILTENQKMSLAQCYNVLNKFPIKLICPRGLNISEYKKINSEVQVEFIDPQWLSTYQMFNRLKIDSLLYRKFKMHKYILFYELDAWVFRDELQYWCNNDYDYIGAPWFEGFDRPISNKIVGVGNGGFSLRKVGSAIRLSKRMNFLRKLRKFWCKSHLQRIFTFESFLRHTRKYFKIKDPGIMSIMDNPSFAIEDRYWSILSNLFNDYRIAPIEEAIKFSFEVNPSILFKSNKYQLPFGCHAWEKYDSDFWKEVIPINESVKEPMI